MDITSPSPFTQMNATSTGETCYYLDKNVEMFIFAILTILFGLLGMLGNGLVIWLLGSSMKRNTFAIYIINLSVADFGLLTFELIFKIYWLSTDWFCYFPYQLFQAGWLLMYNTGQFLLTVISIDRCVSVLFPIWYRCHRPVHLYTAVCAVIWAISFILSSIYFKIQYPIYPFIINSVFCLPLMTISSVTLFIKICFISKSQRRRNLLTAVLLTLFFFLVLAFPLNAIYLVMYVQLLLWNSIISPNLMYCGHLFACINSSINPVIYYLVGRHGWKARKGIKDLFQKVFKEEELSTDELETSEGSKI